MAIAKQLQQALFTGFTTATMTPATTSPKVTPVFLDQNLNASVQPASSLPIVPIAAVGVAAFLLYKHFKKRG